MRRMGITGKIWSSVAVFAGGALIAIVANQLQATVAERELAVSERLFAGDPDPFAQPNSSSR